MTVRLRAMAQEDAAAVLAIYREGIETGLGSLETEVPAWADWDAAHLATCRIVALCDQEIAGFAALNPVSRRHVYRGVAEVSIYVAAAKRGTGVGGALLDALVDASEAEGFWTLQAGVFPENVASLALHRGRGFRVVGTRERIGTRAGRWRDVVLLERRSRVAGV